MREAKLPYALDQQGQVVAALTAPQHADYTCLACGQQLALRRRRGQRPHFSHPPEAQKTCTGERAAQLAAKHLLKEQVQQELEAQSSVRWYLRCPGVNGRCQDHAILSQQHDLAAWDAVALEVSHGLFRFDVAVMYRGAVVFGFEVFFRHEVPEDKPDALTVPWLALCAEDILAFCARVPYQPQAADVRCEMCEDLASRQAEREIQRHARERTGGEFAAESKRVAGAWHAVLKRAQGTSSSTSE